MDVMQVQPLIEYEVLSNQDTEQMMQIMNDSGILLASIIAALFLFLFLMLVFLFRKPQTAETPQAKIPEEPSGKMGFLLDTTFTPPRITGFSETSNAKKVGIRQKDQIVSIDGIPITTYADVRMALMGKYVGELVNVEVLRKTLFSAGKHLSFDVELV